MRALKFGGFAAAVLLVFYLSCVHHLDSHQVAIVRNSVTGQLWCDTSGGFYFTAPWVRATRIDTRPMRVCVTTSGLGFNCKLVKFEPSAYREFVEVEGFRYYWWANRISFNLGYDGEYRGMRDLLRGHAYGVQKYPFITVLQDYQEP